MLRRAGIWFCLITATFAGTWIDLATARRNLYYLREPVLQSTLSPILVAEVAVALCAAAIAWILNRLSTSEVLRDWTFVCVFTTVWFLVCRNLGRPWLALGVVVAGLAVWRIRKAAVFTEHVVLASVPVLLLLVSKGVWASLIAPGSFGDRPVKPPSQANRTGERVVMVIFDDLGRDVAFDYRPAFVKMPNFDRLAGESFFAVNAESPSYHTSASVAAMTMGRTVFGVRTDHPDTLNVQLSRNGPFVSWASQPTVFDDVAELQENSAISGWYHPYGRVLNEKASSVFWASAGLSVEFSRAYRSGSLWERAVAQLTHRAIELPLVGRIVQTDDWELQRTRRIECLRAVWQHGKDIAADTRYQFAFIHLPVPHGPGIYDRNKRELSASTQSDYFDNLVLADRLLGELLGTLVDRGVDANTHVVVASDHGVRWRLPRWAQEAFPGVGPSRDRLDPSSAFFCVRLAGSRSGMKYMNRFNTVAVRDIVRRLLTGKARTPGDIARFLDGIETPQTVTDLRNWSDNLLE